MAIFFGTQGNDTLIGGVGDDFFDGGTGDDTLNGGGGNDTASYAGAKGPVTVDLELGSASGADGKDTLVSIEKIIGSPFSDTLIGDLAANSLNGGAGNDALNAGAGDDYLEGGLGDDTLDGGADIDQVSYSLASGAVVVNLALGTVTGADGNDTIRGIETVYGSAYADTLTGDDGANQLYGLDGRDILSGGVGDDFLSGGASDDTIDGGSGSDTATFSGDFANYTATYDPVSGQITIADASFFRDGTDVLRNVERFRFNDVTKTIAELQKIPGTTGDDILTGGDQSEDISGGAGKDALDGGAGDDTLNGGAGDDTLNGGLGQDLASYATATGAVTVNLVTGKATGADGNDTLVSIEDVLGSPFDDTLIGDAGANVLLGAAGMDTLQGGAGNDTLDGGAGADSMDGGAGSDTYVVDDLGDLVIELADATQTPSNLRGVASLALGQFADLVKASISYTLPNFVENLTLTTLAGHLSGTGNALGNVLAGNEGNNTFTGAGGNDTIDGGAGVDSAIFSSQKSDYTVGKSGSTWAVSHNNSGSDGTDTLTNVERLRFADKKVALDLGVSERGGMALEFIGLMAPDLVSKPSVVGVILDVFDQGKTMRDVCQLALDIGLVNSIAGASTNEALAAMAFRNLIGFEATAPTIDLLVGYMDGRHANYSQTDFMAIVAGLDINQAHIGLVGLQQTGVEYA